MDKSGKLYVVATPIGNLEDMTLRAIRILKEVSLIAAEDTRGPGFCLKHYDIRTSLTSLYEQNESTKSPFIIDKIKEGQSIAYVTDAGTPAISDPGYLLVRHAIETGIEVVPIPGVSALITALCVSGLPMDHFVFQGFLPDKKGKKKAVLLSLGEDSRTQIFYESPNRLLATLNDIRELLGNRFVVVARELTKIYEEVVRGDVEEVIHAFAGRKVKGEITLVVAGKKAEAGTWIRKQGSKNVSIFCLSRGAISRRDMIDRIAADLSLPRKASMRPSTACVGNRAWRRPFLLVNSKGWAQGDGNISLNWGFSCDNARKTNISLSFSRQQNRRSKGTAPLKIGERSENERSQDITGSRRKGVRPYRCRGRRRCDGSHGASFGTNRL